MNKVKKEGFAFGKENYKILILGIVMLIIGYILMIGGGSDNPNVFNEEELFSFRRIVLSPIIILAGFVTILFSIMKKSKE